MATNTYIALIHKDPDSDYGVSFPDLPGCVAAASSLDEVLAEAKEALSLHIEGMLEDGEEVPLPAPADAIDRNGALMVAAIDVPDTLQVERINITVPAIALARFDNFALRQGMTRSALIVEAVNRWIEEDKGYQRPPSPLRRITRVAAFEEVPLAAAARARPSVERSLSAIQEALSVSQDQGAEKETLPEEQSAQLQSQAEDLIEAIERLVREKMIKFPK